MQKYAEVKSKANKFALPRREPYKWPSGQKYKKNGGSDEYQGEFSIIYEILT